ncbi:MAG: tyrosine-protein phosphatase [Solobacterium sp.]|nr:tyrosine-protein phosphatase [Solobacterium sp.]MBQ6532762.1 tyrosine-protein phosphatase [Solobacterium sp.]MBR0213165.1 tyrosine-protein phosphatase [Solobacterium sp.]
MEISGIRQIINFRDLGGYSTAEGRIKKGILYRSGSLWQLNEEELQIVRDLRIQTVLDLRSGREQDYRPDPVIPGAKYVRVSAMTDGLGRGIDFSINGIKRLGAEGEEQLRKMRAYYAAMPYGNEAIACLFEILLAERLPVVFHCASGKDRTGIAAMAVLLALGVSDGEILKDYMISGWMRRQELFAALAENREVISEHPVREDLLIMREGVASATMLGVLAGIRERYGTYKNYLEREYGLDKQKIKKLRSICLN